MQFDYFRKINTMYHSGCFRKLRIYFTACWGRIWIKSQISEKFFQSDLKNIILWISKNSISLISLISDFLFRSCLSMLCSIVANFGTHPIYSFLISGFYNEATDALLNQYGTEVSSIKGSSTWKSIIVYMNLIRGIDNIGVNAAWVIKFYLKGKLSNDEMVQYLRSQVSSLEYLNQASNFSPDVRQKLQEIRTTRNYRNLYAM